VTPRCSDLFELDGGEEFRISSRYLEQESFRAGPHQGIDLLSPEGTLLTLESPGEVVFSGPAGGFGNAVVIQTDFGQQLFAHMLTLPAFVPGQQVPAYTPLGLTGKTGTVRGKYGGAHLHTERHYPGAALGPDLRRNPTNVAAPCQP